ncbi:MAG: helix-turn-helix domain-containing protein [Sphingobacteriaceae bacterium]|nr:helix-turn-helix domain-containing protein [Sphingobacteriaceae bacterium]
MNKLLELRERCNLTQEELAEKSGISVRTIQRLEAGQTPKGYTLKALAVALAVDEAVLSEFSKAPEVSRLKWCKIINFCSLPLMLLPPLNVLVPLAIIFGKKQDSLLARKLISLQIIWTLVAVFLFFTVLMLNDWLGVKSQYTMLIPIGWLLVGVVMIVNNAFEMAKKESPRILPNLILF